MPGPDPSTSPAVAAIDIGSNALRMVVADVTSDGHIEIIERLQRAVRLGQDTFRRGRLGAQSMRAALGVLKDYQQLLKMYSVGRLRAVATSAVREATNSEVFLDRIFVATGLHVEVIDTSEESRLTVSAVQQALAQLVGSERQQTLIADVGGGSTLLTMLEGSEIVTSQSLRLGSIRLQEILSTSEQSPKRSAELLRGHITNAINTIAGTLPLGNVRTFVAVGGDARFAARQIGEPSESHEFVRIQREAFDKLVDRCQRRSIQELAKEYGLPFAEAETVNPALLVYQAVWRATQAEAMLVSHATMRDGLLLELARQVTGRQDETLLASIIHSAKTLAEKYHADPGHGETVARLSLRLFDATSAEHHLGERHRLLLWVAALVHEVGGYVSNRSHHKHSEYLIANSEIFGLSRQEIGVVAQVARYHRRSPPRASHPNYMALTRENRVVVNKLAAILRVADALARGPASRTRALRIERNEDDLVLSLPGASDLLLEQYSVAGKGDLFEEVFGMKVRLEEA